MRVRTTSDNRSQTRIDKFKRMITRASRESNSITYPPSSFWILVNGLADDGPPPVACIEVLVIPAAAAEPPPPRSGLAIRPKLNVEVVDAFCAAYVHA